ncbi:MAG: diphthine synthase [Candidatus Geothermarchaeota archaeon]
MVLYVIGLGIYGQYDVRFIPQYLIELLKTCDEVYLEKHTSVVKIDIGELCNLIGKQVIVASREALEEKSYALIRTASARKIALLTPGDPLIATNHAQLIVECVKNKVDVKVFYASSALCAAISASGLHVYKFGPPCTIVRESKAPSTRCYQLLKDNVARGLHSIFFLEYDYEEGYVMKPIEALRILASMDEEHLLVSEDRYIILLCGLGSNNELKMAIKYQELPLLDTLTFMEPCMIIITGSLHYTEREYIETVLRGGPF